MNPNKAINLYNDQTIDENKQTKSNPSKNTFYQIPFPTNHESTNQKTILNHTTKYLSIQRIKSTLT